MSTKWRSLPARLSSLAQYRRRIVIFRRHACRTADRLPTGQCWTKVAAVRREFGAFIFAFVRSITWCSQTPRSLLRKHSARVAAGLLRCGRFHTVYRPVKFEVCRPRRYTRNSSSPCWLARCASCRPVATRPSCPMTGTASRKFISSVAPPAGAAHRRASVVIGSNGECRRKVVPGRLVAAVNMRSGRFAFAHTWMNEECRADDVATHDMTIVTGFRLVHAQRERAKGRCSTTRQSTVVAVHGRRLCSKINYAWTAFQDAACTAVTRRRESNCSPAPTNKRKCSATRPRISTQTNPGQHLAHAGAGGRSLR